MTVKFKSTLIFYFAGLTGIKAYLAIFGVLFVCGLGLPLPEDITLIAAGILAAIDSISLTGAILVGFFGVLVGDALLFNIGRKFGRRVFDSRLLNKIFTRERLAMAEGRVLRNSRFICFSARFLPGLRAPIYLTAGALGVKPMTFYILDGLAALISVPVWVFVGWWFGNNIDEAIDFAKEAQLYIFGGVFILAIAYVLWKKRFFCRTRISAPSGNQAGKL